MTIGFATTKHMNSNHLAHILCYSFAMPTNAICSIYVYINLSNIQ